MNKTVLVTGASGYLGGRLCLALTSSGHHVRAFVRRSSDLSCLPPSVELAYGDVTDLPSLLAACAGCDIVFHAAALVEPWLPDPSKFSANHSPTEQISQLNEKEKTQLEENARLRGKVNVGGLKNVLRAFKETDTLQKIIYTSSYFALGSTDGYVADEKQVHPGELFCTEYEKSKAIADTVALQAATDGTPIVLLYPGVIYGPGKRTTGNIVARILIERFNGRLPGYIGPGSDISSFCHVDDVVNGHIAAMHKGRVGERYLLTGENASFKQVFDISADVTNTRRPWFHIPLWVVETYGWISVLLSRITGKLPLISYPTVRVMRHQWAYSCEKAKKELGYNPRSLREGLVEMLAWLKSIGEIKY